MQKKVISKEGAINNEFTYNKSDVNGDHNGL